MGSTESTLPAMDDDTSHPRTTTTTTTTTAPATPRSTNSATDRHRNALRETDADNADPWWWEVENENLILDQVPISGDRSPIRSNESVERCESVVDRQSDVTLSEKREATSTTTDSCQSVVQSDYQVTERSEVKKPTQSLDEFKEELRVKRLARQTAVQDLRDEIATLRSQLATEQAVTRRIRKDNSPAGDVETLADACIVAETAAMAAAASLVDDADDVDPMSRGRHANIELANAQLALQLANSENLSLRTELGVVQKQVGTLKEVIACCKQMLVVKEEQCTQLKSKLSEIETSFSEREMKIMSANLRQEYERQLGNIRQLRQLYEERQRVAAAEHENLQRLLSIKKDELSAEQEKTKSLEERNQTLMKEVENANNELAALRDECNEHKFEKRALKEEMATINTLFSQMVMGFNGKNNLDIDRLTMMLEENRTLLNDMATKEANCSDGATLPKLLFELVEQASSTSVGGKDCRCSTPQLTELDDDADQDDDDGDGDGDGDDDVEEVDQGEHATLVVVNASGNTENPTMSDDRASQQLSADALTTDLTATTSTSTSTATMKIAKKHHRRSACAKTGTAAAAAASLSMATLRCHEPEVIGKVATAQEIIGNLPKVWKVLMELLSHHKIERVQFEENGHGEDCYKSVETPTGPRAELSVSKTYIKLKDLILEKKSLVKETNRLKTLNSHLEYRLNEQEKRLSAVSLELTKTWHMVGKMQRQHRQLHTQEQILRYQLQQKRRLLSELKDELEYCRRKWAAARAKNDESQEQCNDLRREFARRKVEDAHNSTESGYSDSGPPSDEDATVADSAATAIPAATATTGIVAVAGGNCRRKQHLKELFEHTRKIKRMQSTSPGRAACGDGSEEIVLRWNSAPPTCGWRRAEPTGPTASGGGGGGAIPKSTGGHSSRSKQRGGDDEVDANTERPVSLAAGDEELADDGRDEPRSERASRIQRLEEQCKSLIQQVLETSDNRERLEVQLCRFQDAIAPVQYAVPLDEFINKRLVERMTRSSSAPAAGGSLTPREEEYTRKRSERLERLEEESRQLMSRIKRTSDRGHYLRCSLDRIRRAPSREGSFESNTEEEAATEKSTKPEVTVTEAAPAASGAAQPSSPLTAVEEAYTTRRAARLQRLEEQGKQLLTKLTGGNERAATLGSKLDTLHERYGGDETASSSSSSSCAAAQLAPESPGGSDSIEQRIENIEKISTNRDERLRILEEEGKQLLTRLSNSSERGTQLINRIAERELSRQARASSATPPIKEQAAETENAAVAATAAAVAASSRRDSSERSPVAAGALLPTPKNVASTCIVDEELTEHVTVTTTASQIAKQQGATPKSKPVAQLSAARPRGAAQLAAKASQSSAADAEKLEDMVKRLRDLPFPSDAARRPDDGAQQTMALDQQEESPPDKE